MLYIAGTGRSGSTLLARLLADVPGYVSVGELRYVWERGFRENHLCECGAPFRECAFWREVAKEAFGGVDQVDAAAMMDAAESVDRIRFVPMLMGRRLRTARFDGRLDSVGPVLRKLYSAILRVSGGDVVVDSSKDPSYAFVLNALGDLELGVVHLVRDSRAVAYSWTRTKTRPEIHWRSEVMNRRHPLRSASLWDLHNLLFELLDRTAPRFLRLRYEDLAAEPEVHVAAARAVLPAMTKANGAGAAPRHSISGNPMRFDRGPLRVRLDDEWRAAMPAPDVRLVTLATAPFLARYGYLSGRAEMRV